MPISFRILGPLEVISDGRAVALGGAKQRAVLADLLIHANQVVSVDRLIDDLWGEEPPETATNVLQVYVSGLRKALRGGAEPILATRAPGYVLRVGSRELDLDLFQSIAAEARDLIGNDPAVAASKLATALELFRGPPLGDFAFEAFAAREIARLEELRVAAVEDWVEAELALGRHAAVVGELQRLIAEHPLREQPRSQLLLALYRSGRQAEALDAYRAFRERMAEDLGIDPSPMMRRLESAILNQDPGLELTEPRRQPIAASREGTVPAGAKVAPREELKTVSVLSCGLARPGFDRAGPEAIVAAMSGYRDRLRIEIERFGGTVEASTGDTTAAIFGAPITHEDDAERAVRAGLRILEAIAEGNETDADPGLAVRIGIDTGEAVVRSGVRPESGQGTMTGDVVDTALQLQGFAPEGALIVGEETHRATERIFVYTALDPVAMEGRASPVAIFRAMEATAPVGVELLRAETTAMVGRDDDLALLVANHRKAAREASVQLVTITGEPGVGKSRLVAELLRSIKEGPEPVRWRQGRCLPYGDGITFWALGEIVKAEAGIFETDPPEVAASKIDRVVADDEPDAPWLRQRLRPLVGLEAPHATREENFAAWRKFLESLAESSPSVFVFEDLHWADDALLAFLEHVAGHSIGVPMLVIATARPEIYERVPAWATSARNSARINLSALSDDDTARLIENLLEQVVLPAEVHQPILALSGGNPLYAEQIVHLLKEQGILTRHGATWTIDPSAEIPMPSELHGIIAARLDTLPFGRKRLLGDAAVLGQVFWSGAVARMAERDDDEVRAGLHELSVRDFVRPARRSSVEGQAEYAFSHALVRDVCYAQLPKANRAELHMKAATWIEAVSGERVADLADILAGHYVAALDLARASMAPAPATAEAEAQAQAGAIRFLTLAGDRAMGIDVAAAERHYSKALSLAPAGHPERPSILSRHASALEQRGRFAEAAQAFEKAIEGLRFEGDVAGAALAMGPYSVALTSVGDPRSHEVAAEAVAGLEPLGPSPALVEALAWHAGTVFTTSQFRHAIELAERALALARQLGLPEPAKALGFRGYARCMLGDAGGLDDLRQALDVAKAQGLGREVALRHHNLAWALGPIEGPRESLRVSLDGLAFAEAKGIEASELGIAVETIGALVELGDWDEAMALADRLADRFEATGDVYDKLLVRSSQIRVLIRRGDLAAAEPLAAWCEQNGRNELHPGTVAWVFPPAALVRLDRGDPAGARSLLREVERTPNARNAFFYAWNLSDAVRTALAADDADLAADLVEGLEPVNPLHEHALITAGALLAEDRGDHAQAAEAFADAARRWEAFEMPWERAQALLGEGRCLLAVGRGSEAVEPVRAARRIYLSLGAGPAVAQAEGVMDRATARIS